MSKRTAGRRIAMAVTLCSLLLLCSFSQTPVVAVKLSRRRMIHAGHSPRDLFDEPARQHGGGGHSSNFVEDPIGVPPTFPSDSISIPYGNIQPHGVAAAAAVGPGPAAGPRLTLQSGTYSQTSPMLELLQKAELSKEERRFQSLNHLRMDAPPQVLLKRSSGDQSYPALDDQPYYLFKIYLRCFIQFTVNCHKKSHDAR